MKKFVIGFLVAASKGIHCLTKILPSRFVLWCTSTIGSLVRLFCAKDEKISIAQLRYVFSGHAVSEDTMRTITRRVFRHIGESVGELMLWDRFFAPSSTADQGDRRRPVIIGTQAGDEIFSQLKRDGQSAVGLSAHLGSFELLAAYLAKQGLPCSVVGRAPNYPMLKKFISNFRNAYGVNVIWANCPDAPRQIVNAVRNGHIICTLIDQDTKLKSEFSPFFGLDAANPIAPIQLAIRYKLPILSSFIVRTGPLTHHVTTERIPYEVNDADAKTKILSVYNKRLENLIQSYPEQYIWWHRRWRRRPGIDYLRSPQLLRTAAEYMEWLGTLGQAAR